LVYPLVWLGFLSWRPKVGLEFISWIPTTQYLNTIKNHQPITYKSNTQKPPNNNESSFNHKSTVQKGTEIIRRSNPRSANT
ncbi:hypothetical protein LINPERPRIM_LOCUS30595, partial [Linum perenne]